MAHVTRVGDLEALGLGGRDEAERMTANVHTGDGLGNLGHVAGDAFAAGAAGLVMGVLLDRRRARPVGRIRPVTFQAHHVRRFQ